MTASVMPFPKSPTVVPIRQQVANLAVLPAAGSSLIFMTDGKMGAGTVIVALPKGQILVKVEDNARHPKAGQKIWISRGNIRTHAIFTPPADLTAPPVDPNDFPPAAA